MRGLGRAWTSLQSRLESTHADTSMCSPLLAPHQAAVARASMILRSQRARKAPYAKKARGKKATAAPVEATA